MRISRVIAAVVVLAAFGSPGAASVDRLDPYWAAGVQRITGAPPAPPFAMTTLDGRTVDSASLRGKIVLVNFWATWCGPCKDEMPALQRLRRSLSDRRFEVLAVTADREPEAIRHFARTLNLEFPILLDETRDVSAAFGVRGLPTTVVIDRNGRWVGRAVGPREWDGPAMMTLFEHLTEAPR
ncbi:MAG TPA: TlpA disulfide reductase family protein [Nitrospiraceae bacterium]|jgi:peroxiredoxin|nr:TlpA disulfide reductase family protein [Nitrospiraceae bacterium]